VCRELFSFDLVIPGKFSANWFMQSVSSCFASKANLHLIADAQSSGVWSPLVVALYPTAAAASLATSVGVLQASKAQGKEPASISVPLQSTTRDGWIYRWAAGMSQAGL